MSVLGEWSQSSTGRFEDACTRDINIWNVAKLLLRESDEVLEVPPIGHVTFGELDILVLLHKTLGAVGKFKISDENFGPFSDNSFG